MSDAKLIAVTRTLPKYQRKTAEIIPFVSDWLASEGERYTRKAIKIFEGSGVETRYGIMDVQDVFTPTDIEEKNARYMQASKEMGAKVLKDALEQESWDPQSLDFIITVSCTGFMIPSLDAYLINELHLNTAAIRLPVTEMGCAAGVSGLIYALQFLQSNPEKRGAIVAVECASATFQHNDKSMANVVSTALFGDGASCVLVSSKEEDKGPKIKAGGMYHFPDSTHLMGFKWSNTGLQMILDPDVPEMIASHFPKIIPPFLEAHGWDIAELNHLIFHPGGRKIVSTAEAIFKAYGKNLDQTKAVLKDFGNLSSVTVLFVLYEFMQLKNPAGTKGLMLSFGPGFSAQRILLEW
ncbi:chalcone synthase [Croceivirga lutea]|uniref:type III polyketide synthase n=1 Tax=Croceivirga lutea TaxID=1775167 RepID=UPI0016395BD2|nr:3-oxoacyl-[acyl-carrier-protein] synthase III C-terminal domain-containing protein [Croceivirga lutea]GGG45373.1 chalcone synthase [Croceivirga lutea]